MEFVVVLCMILIIVLFFIIICIPLAALILFIIFIKEKKKLSDFKKKIEEWKKETGFITNSQFAISLCKNKLEVFSDSVHKILLIVDYKKMKKIVRYYSDIREVEMIYNQYQRPTQSSMQNTGQVAGMLNYKVRQDYGLGPGLAVGLATGLVGTAAQGIDNSIEKGKEKATYIEIRICSYENPQVSYFFKFKKGVKPENSRYQKMISFYEFMKSKKNGI